MFLSGLALFLLSPLLGILQERRESTGAINPIASTMVPGTGGAAALLLDSSSFWEACVSVEKAAWAGVGSYPRRQPASPPPLEGGRP